MNIQGFFTKQIAKIFNVDGILKCEENIHLTRQGISNNDFAHTHKFKGLLETNTLMEEGDLVIVDDTPFLVMAMRKIQFLKTNQANLWLCDDVCSISSYENAYQGNIKIGTTWVTIKENIPCVQRDTNGKVKYFDAGLLESTTKLVYMQYDSQIELGQRLSINGKNYQVDSIDTTVKNILCLQLSPDKRK